MLKDILRHSIQRFSTLCTYPYQVLEFAFAILSFVIVQGASSIAIATQYLPHFLYFFSLHRSSFVSGLRGISIIRSRCLTVVSLSSSLIHSCSSTSSTTNSSTQASILNPNSLHSTQSPFLFSPVELPPLLLTFLPLTPLKVNEQRTIRVADLLSDFRNLQYYIASAPSDPPSQDDYYTEGWAALRQCSIDGQHILNCAAETRVSRVRGGVEEQNKAELVQ